MRGLIYEIQRSTERLYRTIKLPGKGHNKCIRHINYDASTVFRFRNGKSAKNNPISAFLFKLDDFEMMESELDFLKATVLSKSMEPVTMYSDMPMNEMAKDPEFPKKWMYGMAMMLKKGLHFLKVSGAAALSGEAIAGYHSDGKYYLTKSKKEIEYYSKRAQELLNNAHPLMDIYRSNNKNELNAFLLADSKEAGKRRSILSSLPLYTMDETLLKAILERHGLTSEDMHNIQETAAAHRQWAETILKTECVEDEVSDITKEEYLAHLKSTEAFAAELRQSILSFITRSCAMQSRASYHLWWSND